ncbi:MAG: hypothetical protein DME26_18385, partial [Verrucomicrobia bacterium]
MFGPASRANLGLGMRNIKNQQRRNEMQTIEKDPLRRLLCTRRAWCGALVSALLTLGSLFVQADSGKFSGQATVVRATVDSLPPIVLVDTGPLPEEGGAQEATLLEYPDGLLDPLNGALQAQVLHASTVGQGQHSEAEASVANLN